MDSSNYCSAIRSHYERQWGLSKRFRYSGGRWRDLAPAFTVLEFEPRPNRNLWTYATCCMSLPQDTNRIEVHLFAKQQTPSLVELLTVVAHFHRTGAELGIGHTVNFGQPWILGSECNFGLISLPYLDGPDVENGEICGTPVRFLWLIPITAREVEFKKTRGLDALESEFERGKLDYANVRRTSVI